MRGLFLAALSVAILCGHVGAVSAQITSGAVFGKVTDPSGAVLPDVTITLTCPALLQPLTARTGPTGSYEFSRLPVGACTVRFDRDGFMTVVREGVRILLGFDSQVSTTLELSAVRQSVTVRGENRVVDARSTGTQATFSREALQDLPSARDPWAVIAMAPAIVMDRPNVGGAASGDQPNMVSRGAPVTGNVWSLDGVNVTDQAATGGAAMYFDYDSFEEMHISTGGSDVSLQTSGVAVSIVTKSGTDRFRGSSRFFFVNHNFQWNNTDAALHGQGIYFGNPVNSIRDGGIEAGGPVIKGRAWTWGSAAWQDISVGVIGFFKDKARALTNPSDKGNLAPSVTSLRTVNLKGQFRLGRGNGVTWYSNYNEKVRNARDGSDLRPLETTNRQHGPVWTHKLSDQHVFTDRLLVEGTVAHVGGGFVLDFQAPELADVQPSYEIANPSGLYGRSFRMRAYRRPVASFDLRSNGFLPGFLYADHSIKSGFTWRESRSTSSEHYGGNTIARFRNGVASEAQLFRDSVASAIYKQVAFFAQDTAAVGRLSVNAGFRMDYQTDRQLASSVPAHPWLPGFLPAVRFGGADPKLHFADWSPRLGMAFDVLGDGRAVLKGSFARYYAQIGGNTSNFSGDLNPVTAAHVRFPWSDANRDGFVQPGEIDATRILGFGGNYDPYHPTMLDTPNTVDPNLRNPSTTEVIAGLDHELAGRLAVGASFIWRKYEDLTWLDTVGLASSDFVPVTYAASGCPNGPCPTVLYYEPTFMWPAAALRTNRPDFWRGFRGVELTARKRLAHGWSVNASLAYNTASEHYDSTDAYEDPTEVAFLDGAQFSPEETSSGRTGVFNNARWVFRLRGLCRLPAGFSVSAFYDAREGTPFIAAILSPGRRNGAGPVMVALAQVGTTRLADVHQLDAKVERGFRLSDRLRLSTSLEVFNLLNANTALIKQRQQNSTRANYVTDILPPRLMKLGVRVAW